MTWSKENESPPRPNFWTKRVQYKRSLKVKNNKSKFYSLNSKSPALAKPVRTCWKMQRKRLESIIHNISVPPAPNPKPEYQAVGAAHFKVIWREFKQHPNKFRLCTSPYP